MSVNTLLSELLARMPELEWQLNKLGTSFSSQALPRGLFRQEFDAPVQAYVTEIKSDIQALRATKNSELAKNHLALRIHQKINMLVKVCARHNRQSLSPPEEISYGVKQLSTRQQWLQALDDDISLLLKQKESLHHVLLREKTAKDTTALLNVQRELGELEKRLTLAVETRARAIS